MASQVKLRDEILYCQQCGISFLWASEEQRHATPNQMPSLCAGCRQLQPAPGLERGMVKWYSARKRFGFVVRRDQPDLFVSANSLVERRGLQPGELVEFCIGKNDQGPVAEQVRVLPWPPTGQAG